MKRVYLLYCLSGFISLCYQVAWFRIYTDQFGSTNLTFGLVLCNFIAGLGAGALISRRFCAWLGRTCRISDALRLYGLIELILTAAVLLTVLARWIPPAAFGAFPYQLDEGIYRPTTLYQLSQIAIATACVFVPCLFMGVTFPLLCDAFSSDERFPAALYAWNTLGACAGVVACQFLVLPRMGHEWLFWCIAGLNLALGAFFLWTGGAPKRTEPASETRSGGIAEGGIPTSVLLCCAVLSGLLAGALEGDMFKRIGFVIGPSAAAMAFISFWAILGIFLASWVVRVSTRLRFSHIKVGFVLAFLCYVLAWRFAYPLKAWLDERNAARALESVQAGATLAQDVLYGDLGLGAVLFFVGVFVFPAFFFVSLLLPYVCNRLQAARRHLGFAYGLNTLAFCAGTVGFTWIAPRVSVFYSMKLILVLVAIGAGLLLALRERQPLSAWKPLTALAAFVAGCWLTPRGFDRSYVDPDQMAARHPVRAMRSNAAHTTYVVSFPGGDALYFDNHAMSGTNYASQVYMRLMAHFPLLAHPDPRDALLICFGVGNTASAIAKHGTVESIDVVELNHQVVKTAPEFAATNHAVYLDPRLRFIHDDGRSFLKLTDRRYDLITSEPPPPLHVGVYRLYSEEYYRSALGCLKPGGLMTQWVPIYQMPPAAVDLVISTFVKVFPSTVLFTGYGENFILAGSSEPIDLERIAARWSSQTKAAAELKALGVTEPLSLLARVVQDDAGLRSRYASGPTISDQRNDLVHLTQDLLDPAALAYDPLELLEQIGSRQPRAAELLRPVALHFGRLLYRVDDFPMSSLAPAAAAAEIEPRGVPWREVRRLLDESWIAQQEGRIDDAIYSLRRALVVAKELPSAQLLLGQLLCARGRFSDAVPPLQAFVRLEPEAALGRYQLGLALLSSGEIDPGKAHLDAALSMDPAIQAEVNRTAWALATHPDQALRDADRAVLLAELLAEHSETKDPAHLDTLAAAYAARGEYSLALQTAQRAMRLAGAGASPEWLRGCSGRIDLYRRSRPYIESPSAAGDSTRTN